MSTSNTATAILRHEHETIERVLDAALKVATRLERGDPVRPQVLSDINEFFQRFADQRHHHKEEELLFPALERKGLPHQSGPIGVMLSEHDHGRSLVRQMVEAAVNYSPQQPRAGWVWAEILREYTELLRAHISKENNVLFLMAERLLSSDEQRELALAFAKTESEENWPRRLEAMLSEVEQAA
jgi:hemerythrin-like domain-containing protein